MAQQPIVCMNVLCDLFKQKQWNANYVEDGEHAPWDDFPCPKCGRRTEPFWIIEYHYQLLGMKEIEDKILEKTAQIKKLRGEIKEATDV